MVLKEKTKERIIRLENVLKECRESKSFWPFRVSPGVYRRDRLREEGNDKEISGREVGECHVPRKGFSAQE